MVILDFNGKKISKKELLKNYIIIKRKHDMFLDDIKNNYFSNVWGYYFSLIEYYYYKSLMKIWDIE